MATANPRTRRILRAVNWTTLLISIVGAGRMLWEICANGADTGTMLLLGTFLVVATSNILQLIGLHKQAREKAGSETVNR